MPGSARAPGRRASVVTVLVTLGLLGLIAAWAAWRTWFAPDDPAAAAATAPVPEHQRSGPLANPWGNAPAVPASPADEAAAAARAAAAASARAEAAASAAANGHTARPFVPPAREAVVQALARLRGGGEGLVAGRDALAFVQAALQGGDAAALVALWMIERQCRQLMHWRRMDEWRQRANAGRPVQGAGRGAALAPLCEQLPEPRQVDEALAAAGFALAAAGTGQGAGPELTRRPIDLAQAVAIGDPLLLAEVIDATDIDLARQLLRAWGADARDIESPDVLRGALWLASCTPVDGAGRPANTSALKRACADHPALAQACQHHGLCEVRDLRDLLLKSLPPADLAVAERLARGVAGRMGR